MPWRGEKDPYRILVSEIMLQQTRVEQAIPFYLTFMENFPSLRSLAEASWDEVLEAWNGLGYYRRGKQLHQTAQILQNQYAGCYPQTQEEWLSLPGIGRYTAGAILSIAFNLPIPAVDGNVARAMSRFKGLKEDISKDSAKLAIEKILQEVFPSQSCGDFTQALMELGACICFPKNPSCPQCPITEQCYARIHQIQEALPIKQRKPAPKIEKWAVFILKDTEGVLLTQRKGEALLSEFWGLPMVKKDIISSMETAFYQKYGKEIRILRNLGEKKHIFSHRSWHLSIYKALIKTSNQTKKIRFDEDLVTYFPHRDIKENNKECKKNIAQIFQKILDEFED